VKRWNVLTMAALAVLAVGAEVEVRVKPGSAGAPQIHVDGKAVPARMFWGWRGHRPIIVGTAWERFELAFTPKAADPGTIHFRIPSDRALVVFLRNVRVVDTVTGADYLDPASLSSAEAFAKAWTVFDNDTLGHADVTADGCLKIQGWAKNKGPKPKPQFHCYTKRTPFVEGRRYVLSFEAKASEDDVLLRPAAYTCYAGNYTRWPFTGRDPFPAQVKMAADAGVDLVSFMVPKTIWKDDYTYDWADLDDLCDEVIAINPKALLVPRIKLETAGWWARKYPDDVITYADGSKGPAPSVACRHYREKACRFLEAMTRHLCEKYPDRFAGIHPAAQNSSEFFYWDTWSKPFFGYDPATKAAFKAWRRKHGRPEAEVPTLAERKLDIFKSPTLADPVKDSVLVDFRLYLQEEMADFVAEVASVCRKASGGKKLVIIFYG
jgi:beta-galactosidase